MNYTSNLFSTLPNQSNSLFPSFYQNNNVTKVSGIESVKAYQTMPNSYIVLFDANEDVFYLKTTDTSNYPTIRVFNFTEQKSSKIETSEYVTMDEFEQFKKEVLNGKQSIRTFKRKRLDGGYYTTGEEDNEFTRAGKQSSTNVAESDSPKSSIQLYPKSRQSE